ncbi:MAG: hypothetical protein Alis3KO_12120 [Aliiglaciecola sp.]
MKTFKSTKRTLISASIAMLVSSMLCANAMAKTNLVELNNELEIMSNILKTSLKQGDKREGITVRNFEVTYLANQGVVFEVSTSSGRNSFSFEFWDGHDMIVAPKPPVPPLPAISGGEGTYLIDIDDSEWSEEVEAAMEHAHEAMEQARERLRDLRQEERDYSWQRRNNERRLRDIEFQMRNADGERRKELTAEKNELQTEINTLQSQQEEVEKLSKKLAEEQRQKNAEKVALRKKQYAEFLAQFESNVATTLCKYGNGLKALPESENISFVLSRFGSAEQRTRQDRIYVFKNKDVQSCVKDNLSVKKLIERSEGYVF